MTSSCRRSRSFSGAVRGASSARASVPPAASSRPSIGARSSTSRAGGQRCAMRQLCGGRAGLRSPRRWSRLSMWMVRPRARWSSAPATSPWACCATPRIRRCPAFDPPSRPRAWPRVLAFQPSACGSTSGRTARVAVPSCAYGSPGTTEMRRGSSAISRSSRRASSVRCSRGWPPSTAVSRYRRSSSRGPRRAPSSWRRSAAIRSGTCS